MAGSSSPVSRGEAARKPQSLHRRIIELEISPGPVVSGELPLRGKEMFDGLFQPMHLVLIVIAALIIFGPSKLPELGSALGRSIREFKGTVEEVTEGLRTESDTVPYTQVNASTESAPTGSAEDTDEAVPTHE